MELERLLAGAGPAKWDGMLELLKSEFMESALNRQLCCASAVELKCL